MAIAPTSAPASPSTNATPTTVSPVGKLVPSGGIVAGMADGSIALVDASYGVQRTLVPASVGLSTDSVAVNADGTKLFVFHRADRSGRPGCMDLVQIDLATDKSTTLGSFSSFVVSGDGTHLATLTHPVAGTGVCDIFNSPDAKVVVRDLATGTEQTLNPGDGSDLQTVTLSPDGTKFALNYSVGQGRVVIYDLTTSPATVQRTVQVPGTSIDITAMAWTDEGLFVAATPHQGLGDLSDAGYLFDPTTGAKLRTLYELRSSPIGLGSTQQLAPLASGLVEIVVDRNGEHRVEQLSGTMSRRIPPGSRRRSPAWSSGNTATFPSRSTRNWWERGGPPRRQVNMAAVVPLDVRARNNSSTGCTARTRRGHFALH